MLKLEVEDCFEEFKQHAASCWRVSGGGCRRDVAYGPRLSVCLVV